MLMSVTPRTLQITSLSILLVRGLYYRWLDTTVLAACCSVGAAVVCQFVMFRLLAIRGGDYQSALISGISLALLIVAIVIGPRVAFAFCGFYVAKGDSKLFNNASKVVIVRDGEKTVLTMANDFQGDPKEFALVVSVPTFLEKDQIHVGDPAMITRVDEYSAPRLVEYFDPDPCQPSAAHLDRNAMGPSSGAFSKDKKELAKAKGVTIEAEYTVGEYDILLLSADQSNGLQEWLNESGYKVPEGAAPVLQGYLKQKMKFFVAKVNLKEHARNGFTFLRPLQIAFDSPKFMLPIRLETLNAQGDQELFVFGITPRGRIETTNYRTVKIPESANVPLYIRDDFSNFYQSFFATQMETNQKGSVFLEHAWNMSWCDPCSVPPLTSEELKKLSVFWTNSPSPITGGASRYQAISTPPQAFITRLHVRYNSTTFPEDLMFQETADQTNFQSRFVINHPWVGTGQCPSADLYRKQLPTRFHEEALTLSKLTGWDL
jgi:hypothetical protein